MPAQNIGSHIDCWTLMAAVWLLLKTIPGVRLRFTDPLQIHSSIPVSCNNYAEVLTCKAVYTLSDFPVPVASLLTKMKICCFSLLIPPDFLCFFSIFTQTLLPFCLLCASNLDISSINSCRFSSLCC